VPAALASTSPRRIWPLSWADPPLPPGWNKRPPLPTHVHALATGGMPGWQITLIAAAAVLLAAALAVLATRIRATRRRVPPALPEPRPHPARPPATEAQLSRSRPGTWDQ
jgi:hypothetical protein